MSRFSGKKGVVTGGTHGMGLATARALLDGGAEVLLTGRNEHNVETARRELGDRALVVRSDVASMADVHALGALVKDRLGAIDFHHVNAGISELCPFSEVTEETYDRVFAVNTKGAVRAFAQLLAAEMLSRGVRVNTVGPGFINTPTLGVAMLSPEERAQMEVLGDQVTPMKRHGTVEEIARAVLFLGFDATFTTGVELTIDGGLKHVGFTF
jgi:NAD(P)-dependent dehydrogenase (short-subunit alcohol dehydrogenase family)